MLMHLGRGHLLLLLWSEGSASEWGSVRGHLAGVAVQRGSSAGRLLGGLTSVNRLLA